MSLSDLQKLAMRELDGLAPALSDFHLDIWGFSEPAWREYKSSRHYVDLLRQEGFDVEVGSGDMPTAFHATWGEGGREIGLYAEYDASPGSSQDVTTYRKPREGSHPWAPGFTDAHCALGVGALAGALALKRTLEKSRQPGRIHLFGEPAEKVCGSKAVHAAKGYYDSLDASISYHPLSFTTALWDITNCMNWGVVFTFECPEDQPWVDNSATKALPWGPHAEVRSPGTLDALALMITTTRFTKENMFPPTGFWTVNEAILNSSNATADNQSQRVAQIHYAVRSPLIEIQEQMIEILRRNAKHVAALTNCRVSMRWVTRTRPGLPNHALASAVHENLVAIGPAKFGADAYAHGRALEAELGLEVSEDPFDELCHVVTPPRVWDDLQRQALPPWQECVGADDYTEYSWHCPTVRFHTAKPILRQNTTLTHWTNNSMNGLRAAIDPTWIYGGQTIASTALDLIEYDELLDAATEEFDRRRESADPRCLTPLLPADFDPPTDLPWPEYVTTERGYEYQLGTPRSFGELID